MALNTAFTAHPVDVLWGLETLALCFVWAYISLLCASYLGMRLYARLLHPMAQGCDPAAYLQAAAALRVTRRNRRAVLPSLLLNASTAYLALGDADAALQMLQQMPQKLPPGRVATQIPPGVYGNLAAAYVRLGQMPQAQDALQSMHATLPAVKGDAARRTLEASYRVGVCRFQMEQGLYAGAKEALEAAVPLMPAPLSQVSLQLLLARVYLHEGDTAQAQAALQYVLQHGNKTVYVQQARALWPKAPCRPPDTNPTTESEEFPCRT